MPSVSKRLISCHRAWLLRRDPPVACASFTRWVKSTRSVAPPNWSTILGGSKGSHGWQPLSTDTIRENGRSNVGGVILLTFMDLLVIHLYGSSWIFSSSSRDPTYSIDLHGSSIGSSSDPPWLQFLDLTFGVYPCPQQISHQCAPQPFCAVSLSWNRRSELR